MRTRAIWTGGAAIAVAIAVAVAVVAPATAAIPAPEAPTVVFLAGGAAGVAAADGRLDRRALAQIRWRTAAASRAAGPNVSISAAYGADPAVAGQWRSFFGSLLHGSELELLSAYVAPLSEVQGICGTHALGCYGGQHLVTVGDSSGGSSPAAVAAHEYGHHVAYNRVNPPWEAAAWGPKRWASAANICARVAFGTAFPGDEGASYTLNPGEAFAEAYRVLNGYEAEAWDIVDASFRPNAAMLDAVRADVLRPWTTPRPRTVRIALTRARPTKLISIATPLDGTLRVEAPGAAELTLVDAAGHPLAHAAWAGNGTKVLEQRVCGTRFARLRVTRAAGGTSVALRVVTP